MLLWTFALLACLSIGIAPRQTSAQACDDPVDVIFVLDASSSGGQDNFNKLLYLAGNVTQNLNIGPGAAQVGMMTYSGRPHSAFKLNTYDNKHDLLEAISKVQYEDGGRISNTASALNYARAVMLGAASVGRRSWADAVLVLVTDSSANDYWHIPSEAEALQDLGVVSIAVGIGKRVDPIDLTAIANGTDNTVSLDSFDDISCSLQEKILKEVGCEGAMDVPPTHSGPICPPGVPRNQYLQVHNGICYYFSVDDYRHYDVAERRCEQDGGYLVMIKSAETNAYIHNQLAKTYGKTSATWIGLNDVDTEGHFVWADGSTAVYTNWAHGEGKQDDQDCHAIDPRHGGFWQDFECGEPDFFHGSKPYVCQYDMVTPSADILPSLCPAQTLSTQGANTATTTQGGNTATTTQGGNTATTTQGRNTATTTQGRNTATTTQGATTATTTRGANIQGTAPIIG